MVYVKGIFKKRPNRFIAEVEVDGNIEIAHVPNTGRCRELLVENAVVWLEPSDNPKRKTKFILHFVENRGELVSLYSQEANSIVYDAIINGQIKEHAKDISAKAASTFYAVDRYITYKKEIEPVYTAGESVIVFDRWVESNIIHQGAKLIAEISHKEERQHKLEEFILWLHSLEYLDFEVPKPDVTIYLNVPVDYTIKLRRDRANKITGGEKQDIHEADEKHLIDASASGMLAAKILNWQVIECVREGSMRTIEDIAQEVWQRVNK